MTTEDLTLSNCQWTFNNISHKFIISCRLCFAKRGAKFNADPTIIDAISYTWDRKLVKESEDGPTPVVVAQWTMLDYDLVRCKHCGVKFRFEDEKNE
jgi:hypothetical protein